MAVVNKSLPLAMPSDSSVYCHTSLALCYNYYINDHCGFIGFVSISASLTKHFLVTFPCAGSDSFVQANLRSHSEYVGDLLEVWEPWFIVSSWLASPSILRDFL